MGSFAALVLTVYSALSFVMSRFQDSRVDNLLLTDLYRQNSGGSTETTGSSNNLSSSPTSSLSQRATSPKSNSSNSRSSHGSQRNNQATVTSSDEDEQARKAFKARVEGSSGFNLRFLSYAADSIVAFLYNLFCQCCCCCKSDRRGPACCLKRAKYLKRYNLAT